MTASADSPATPNPAPSNLTPPARRARTFGFLRVALFATLVALPILLRVFFFDGFKNTSPSMTPTLFAGEHFLVHKSAYGFGAHRTPERGDVIVFPSPEHPDQDYVDRVIGLPGDTIQIQQGAVFINGWRLPSCVAGLGKLAIEGREHVGVIMVELLGDTAYIVMHEDNPHSHEEQPSESAHEAHTSGPFTVPPNEVFVLGDRRENSHDSREWLAEGKGGVRIDTIKGRAGRIWMSRDETGLRKSRLGVSLASQAKCPEQLPAETCQGVEKCLANRPPRDVTTPTAPGPKP